MQQNRSGKLEAYLLWYGRIVHYLYHVMRRKSGLLILKSEKTDLFTTDSPNFGGCSGPLKDFSKYLKKLKMNKIEKLMKLQRV